MPQYVRLTFFEKIRNLLFAQPPDRLHVSIMAQKCKNIIGKDVCICIRAVMLSYQYASSLLSMLDRSSKTYVFSSLFTIHFFSCGASCSENSIPPNMFAASLIES